MKSSNVLPFIEAVVRGCEFSGYGPATVSGPNSMKIHYKGAIHEITFDSNGCPDVFPSVLHHQNKARPDVQAVFSVLHGLAKQAGEPAPLQDVYRSDWETDGHLLRLESNYAWMECPISNTQLVLHELFFNNEPIWHKVGHSNYTASNNTRYFPEVEAMLEDFMKHGRMPDGLDEELMATVLKHAHSAGAEG